MQRIALVTGGSRGIGLAIVRQLAADGCAVVILDVNPQDQYPETFAALDQAGICYLYVQGSISDADDRERCVKLALERFGRIDILVNNAGIAPKVRADLMDMSEESFDRLISVNTKGTLFMSQTVARQMIRQDPVDGKRGVIVNISSISATVVSVSRGEYCLSKAGVSMLTQLFAARLAADGILVYEVRPGIIATDMTSGVKAKYDALFEQGICPIKRWGTPEDVAGAVSIFCSGKLDYTTGQCIDVDGGFHISRL